MAMFRRRVFCALGFLAVIAFCNVASQILGFAPGLVVAESDSICRYFKPGTVDWSDFSNYMSFVVTLVVSFVLVQQVADYLTVRPNA